MKKRIKITNKTDYRLMHLRRFVEKTAKEILPENYDRQILVWFLYSRRRNYVCGSAPSTHQKIYIWLPRTTVDQKQLAVILARQMGSLRGISNREMRGRALYDPRNRKYKELYAWADELPLCKEELPRSKTIEGEYLRRLKHATEMIEKAHRRIRTRETELRRAQKILRLWEKVAKRLEESAQVAGGMVLDMDA
jgi:hypothetical protein